MTIISQKKTLESVPQNMQIFAMSDWFKNQYTNNKCFMDALWKETDANYEQIKINVLS